MRKKRKNISGNIEKWKLAFLLDGVWPDKSLGFVGFGFANGNPLEVWESVKDGPVVQAWRAANPGKRPYAERLANMNVGEFHGNQYQVVSVNLPIPKISQAEAAKLLNVSERRLANHNLIGFCRGKGPW